MKKTDLSLWENFTRVENKEIQVTIFMAERLIESIMGICPWFVHSGIIWHGRLA